MTKKKATGKRALRQTITPPSKPAGVLTLADVLALTKRLKLKTPSDSAQIIRELRDK